MNSSSPPAVSSTRGLSGWWERRQARLAPLMFVAPAFVAFTLYVVAPILQSLWISLHDWDGLGPMTYVGTANYRELFSDASFRTALGNNAKWLVLFMLGPPAGLGLALFLNQRMRGMRLIKSLFFLPFVLSQVVVGLAFSWFYDPSFGLLNQLLGVFGAGPISPLADERMVTYFIIIAGLWPQVSYCMVLYLAGLTNINPDIIEAARLDGAEGLRMLWSVVLPQLRPASFMAVVVTIIGALRSFDLVAIMTNGGPYDSSTVLAYLMYEQSIFSYRMGYGAAVATVLFLVMDCFIAFFLYSLLRKERD